MSKYNVNLKKVEYLYGSTYLIFDEIAKQELVNENIIEKKEKFTSLSTQLQAVIDTTGDWVLIEPLITEGVETLYAGYTWTFLFPNMTEELLNSFMFDFSVATGDGETFTPLKAGTTIKKRVTYQRNQSLSDPNVFDLKVDASIIFEGLNTVGGGVQSDTYARLITLQKNPYLFTNG